MLKWDYHDGGKVAGSVLRPTPHFYFFCSPNFLKFRDVVTSLLVTLVVFCFVSTHLPPASRASRMLKSNRNEWFADRA